VARLHDLDEPFFDKLVDITEVNLARDLHIPLKDNGTDVMSLLFSTDMPTARFLNYSFACKYIIISLKLSHQLEVISSQSDSNKEEEMNFVISNAREPIVWVHL
jgi:hypothetical protein